MGQVQKMSKGDARHTTHVDLCSRYVTTSANKENDERDSNASSSQELPKAGPSEPKIPKTSLGRISVVKDANVVQTSQAYAKTMDVQVGRYFFATNTPFLHANHTEFKKMCNILRPGYKPPSAAQIGGPILDQVYEDTLEQCKKEVMGQTVSMSLDGWSNIKNEPIVCCSITTPDGKTILADTIDTSGNPHTSEYLKSVAINSIKKTEQQFNVKVRSFVTDNAANVTKMRKELEKQEDIDIIQYGCSAHLLNLLAEDFEIKGVVSHILKVIKYLRNKHLPDAWYRVANGKMLVMPIAVRWNTMRDAIRSYLENRGAIVQVCQNHQSEIDSNIQKIINDVQITNNAIDLLARLDPVSIALDRAQSDSATIAVVVEIWNKLEKDLDNQPLLIKEAFKIRRNTALSGYHYLANIIDHRFRGRNLSQDQIGKAFNVLDSNYMAMVTAILTESRPFPSYLFGTQFRNTSPLAWWKLTKMSSNDSEWINFKHKKLPF